MRLCSDCKFCENSFGIPFCEFPGTLNRRTGFMEKTYHSCEVNRNFRLPFTNACGMRGRWFQPKAA